MRELFDVKEYRRPLTQTQRLAAAGKVITDARFGLQYTYKMKEVAGILNWSIDQVFEAVKYYKIDAVKILGIVRIPWWSLAEYLIDPASDIDAALAEYIRSLPHKEEAVNG